MNTPFGPPSGHGIRAQITGRRSVGQTCRVGRSAIMAALCVTTVPAGTVRAESPPESTLGRIMRFNPWLSPEDPLQLPMKVRAISQDEYTFFRGTADLFYDWCRVQSPQWSQDDDANVLLHGDIHLGNTGTYPVVTTDGRRAIRFGVVDPDETVRGPFQLDLLRALTTLRLAAVENKRPLNELEVNELTRELVNAYRDALTGQVKAEDLARRHPVVAALIAEAEGGDLGKAVRNYCKGKPARQFRTARLKKGNVSDLMRRVDDKTRAEVIEAVWLYVRTGDEKAVRDQLRLKTKSDVEKQVRDVVRWTRVESGGSQGIHKYRVLLDRALKDSDAPLILELKEEPVPAAQRAGLLNAATGPARAREVADGQADMLGEPRWLGGCTMIGDRGFLVRARDPFSEEPSHRDFADRAAMADAARLLGDVLGIAHRRGTLRGNDGALRIGRIAARLTTVMPQLPVLSKAAAEETLRNFAELKSDPRTPAFTKRAQAEIDAAAKDAQN